MEQLKLFKEEWYKEYIILMEEYLPMVKKMNEKEKLQALVALFIVMDEMPIKKGG